MVLAVQQIPLTVGLPQSYSFDNFFVTADNKIVVNTLRQFCCGGAGPFIGVLGTQASGKSHLLQAVVAQAANAVFLPLAELSAETPMAVVAGLERNNIICIDDIDTVFGDEAWEYALFHLYNRIADTGSSLLFSASRALTDVDVQLPDLLSRLRIALLFQLKSLSDADKKAALAMRAEAMGFVLNDDTSTYILRHCDRSMPALMDLLAQLDAQCLKLQRRPSVKLLRDMITSASS